MVASVKPFLDTAGKFTVEQIPCPHFSIPVDLDAPRTGVLHTTEGDWTSSLAVFKTHWTPHFLVGFDASQNKVRIAQLVQIGTIGAALVTHNDHALVQIEMVAYSKQTLWTPDDATMEALASLMAVCKQEYGIALMHPWPDGDYGAYGNNPHRGAGKWGVVGGWYAHGDVPLPDVHWDVGAFEWSKVFALANTMTDIVGAPPSPPPIEPPRPCAAAAPPSDTKGPTMAATPTLVIPQWPPGGHPMWTRVAQMVNALRAKGAANPLVIAAITNGYAESDETPKIEGDNDHAYSIFQWWWSPRGANILAATGIDIRTETSIKKIVDAFWWELTTVYPKTFAEMNAATNAADATRALCVEYEGAGAPNAADRRVMMSDYLTVWVAQNEPFIAANPAQ